MAIAGMPTAVTASGPSRSIGAVWIMRPPGPQVADKLVTTTDEACDADGNIPSSESERMVDSLLVNVRFR